MILVDSGAWFSVFVSDDPDHTAAVAWYDANVEPLITTDYVVDETLTLLRARRQPHLALGLGLRLFTKELAQLHYLTPDDIEKSWEVFRSYADKRWSFTDCTSKFIMESLGVTKAFSFDQHFRQFGNIEVVP